MYTHGFSPPLLCTNIPLAVPLRYNEELLKVLQIILSSAYLSQIKHHFRAPIKHISMGNILFCNGNHDQQWSKR